MIGSMKNITYGLSPKKGHFCTKGRLLGRDAASDLTESQGRSGTVSQTAEGQGLTGSGRMKEEGRARVVQAQLKMGVLRKTGELVKYFRIRSDIISQFSLGQMTHEWVECKEIRVREDY